MKLFKQTEKRDENNSNNSNNSNINDNNEALEFSRKLLRCYFTQGALCDDFSQITHDCPRAELHETEKRPSYLTTHGSVRGNEKQNLALPAPVGLPNKCSSYVTTMSLHPFSVFCRFGDDCLDVPAPIASYFHNRLTAALKVDSIHLLPPLKAARDKANWVSKSRSKTHFSCQPVLFVGITV